MRGVLLLNGEPYTEKIDVRGAMVYCCDGAYAWAAGRVRIDKNIGDFDSLGYMPEPRPEEIYPAEKNFTDGEIAIRKLLEAGADEIEIYGGGGGREDHFLGNLQLLYFAHMHGAKSKMITKNSVIFPAEGRVELGEFLGRTFSVLPFGQSVHIMNFEGVKYPYPERLELGECRGISNIVADGRAFLEVSGVALIIVNKGDV